MNLFADMRVQPGTRQSGLVAASASTDTNAPATTITSPASGVEVHGGDVLTVTGTASDTGGGVVGAVEVSVDGGATWHPATGRQSWTYTTTVGGFGTSRSRAVPRRLRKPRDAGPGVTVVDHAAPAASGNDRLGPARLDERHEAVKLGVKFRADVDGYVTGIRYYKRAGQRRHTRRQPLDDRPATSWPARPSPARRQPAGRRCTFDGRSRSRQGRRTSPPTSRPSGGYSLDAFDLLVLRHPQRSAPRARRRRRRRKRRCSPTPRRAASRTRQQGEQLLGRRLLRPDPASRHVGPGRHRSRAARRRRLGRQPRRRRRNVQRGDGQLDHRRDDVLAPRRRRRTPSPPRSATTP